MKSEEIRKAFLDYFAERGHTVVPSSSLVPEKDPTLLFTNAGMVQFKGVFLGEETRDYKRAVSCQKCMRAGGKHNDLENVGVTARHHTFFEMLGNFSFGDYFKEGAVEYAWDFLTRVMGLDREKLWATVYEEDDEAGRIWIEKTDLPAERIVRMGAEDNFWSMGDVGPCGPCSEILIDQGPEAGCGRPGCRVGCDCDRYLELWNLVFMQYSRDASGRMTPLERPSIDTGMGLERLTAVMQGKLSNYDTDLFTPVIAFIEKLASVKYGKEAEKDISIRAVADHSRAVTFLITDGVMPGNVGRNYVLRRIIRRAVRHGRFLGLHEPFLYRVGEKVIELMSGVYPSLLRASQIIRRATMAEEERFFETLDRGLELLEEKVRDLRKKGIPVLPGDFAFMLYDTYGFPLDLTADILKREGISIDREGFERCMAEQRERAREAWKGARPGEEIYGELAGKGLRSTFTGYTVDAAPSQVLCIIKDGQVVGSASEGDEVEIITGETPFYGESGGQVGDTGVMVSRGLEAEVTDTKRPLPNLIVHVARIKRGAIKTGDHVELVPDMERRNAIRRNHTATHILHAVLRRTLGEHVRQAGSLVGPEGFRFDFSHFEALTDEEMERIEKEANRVVIENIEVITDIMPYEAAVEAGALAFFAEKYADTVRMVQVPGVSKELCGGTHVARTGDIGLIKITGERAVAAGTRRLEAVTALSALDRVQAMERTLGEAAGLLKTSAADLPRRIEKILAREKELEREIERLKSGRAAESVSFAAEGVREVAGIKVLAARVKAESPRELREMADRLRKSISSGIVVLGSASDGKALLLAAVTKDLAKRFAAGEIVKRLAPIVGGRGGGKAELAQAGGRDIENLPRAIEAAYKAVEEMAREVR